MSSNNSSKLFSDSGQKCYNSSKTDSGFLSGANLVSEENVSSEDLSASGQSFIEFDVKSNKNMQLDSGVDVGLNEQFSELTLQKKVVNNLNQSAKNNHFNCTQVPKISSTGEEEKPCETGVYQPWELYYQQDQEGDTQLHIAIIQGFIEVVFSLIRMVPHPCFLDILNDIVQSPLHLAVLTHQPRIVRRLVVAGACVEARDRHGNTPLHLACQLGDLDCVKALMEPVSVSEIAAANLLYSGCTQQVPQDFEEKNYEGETCLHLAAYGNHMEILRHLLWFGADINVREDKSGKTILHHAVETLNYKLLNFLLNECPYGQNRLVVDMQNYAGHTAYQLARILDLKIASDLVIRGAQISVEDIDEDDHPDHNYEDVNDEVYEKENVPSDVADYRQ